MPAIGDSSPSYLDGWDGEDRSSGPSQAKSLWDPVSKTTRAEWTRDVVQEVEHMFCKLSALSSNPIPTINKYIHTYKLKDFKSYWVVCFWFCVCVCVCFEARSVLKHEIYH
jgi:hypothetical protein